MSSTLNTNEWQFFKNYCTDDWETMILINLIILITNKLVETAFLHIPLGSRQRVRPNVCFVLLYITWWWISSVPILSYHNVNNVEFDTVFFRTEEVKEKLNDNINHFFNKCFSQTFMFLFWNINRYSFLYWVDVKQLFTQKGSYTSVTPTVECLGWDTRYTY